MQFQCTIGNWCRCINVIWDSSPFVADIGRVIVVGAFRHLVVSNEFFASEYVGTAILTPHHRRIDFCNIFVETIIGYGPRTAVDEIFSIECPILIAIEEYNRTVCWSFVDGINISHIGRKFCEYFIESHWIARLNAIFIGQTPYVFPFENEQFAA